MTAHEVGQKLVALCQEGKNMEAVNTLYADNVVSVEAMTMPGEPNTFTGIDAIRKKHEDWYADTEVHGGTVSGPYPHGDRFCVRFTMDITSKSMGNQRMELDEIGLYTVENGKIVKEEFFYAMG